MKILSLTLLLVYALSAADALNLKQQPPPTRKQALLQLAGSAGAFLLAPPYAQAAAPKRTPMYLTERGSEISPLSPCNGQPVKKSCWSTEDQGGRRLERWTPPKEMKDTASIVKALEETIATYPQAGQADIDKGGWKLGEKKEANGVTYIRYEFTSGRFKYVDELELRVDTTGVVCTRSASREGGFDYDVNKTRLNFIAKALQQKGWGVKLL